jgi:hypothetical protein
MLQFGLRSNSNGDNLSERIPKFLPKEMNYPSDFLALVFRKQMPVCH